MNPVDRDPSEETGTDEDRRVPFWFWAFVGTGILILIVVPIWNLIHLE